MKPHSLRRLLWLANLGLAAGVVGVGAWFALEVRPAVAAVADRPMNYQPEDLKALRKEYESMRVTGLKWTPRAPVEEQEITAVILHPEFGKLDPKHWIFCGPMPPEKLAEVAVGPVEPPQPEGLEVLGKVTLVFLDPPDRSTFLFSFTGGKSKAFGIGDFVRLSDGDAGRFKVTDIREVRRQVYEIRYAVHGKDPATPEREGTFVYDQSAGADQTWPFLRNVGGEQPLPSPGVGTTRASAAGDGGAPADGTAGPGDETAEEPDAGPRVIDPARSSGGGTYTIADLRPIRHQDDTNPNRRAIEFDDRTYDYFRSDRARDMAETVKTSVATDASGRPVGLRITGFTEDAPADVFDVKQGDILISINGQRVTSRSDAINIVQRLSPDNLVTVVIERNGRNITYKVDPRDPRNKRRIRYFENMR